tara:strand:+ start:42089 stop:43174 length:1086 start_codon:yes stop_codon:yes gene_type:complete
MKKCLIISASNIQNIRIRKNLYYFLKGEVDDLKFVGDFLVESDINQIVWWGAYNRGGKIKEIIIFLKLLKIIIHHKPSHVISFAPKVNIYCGLIARFFNYKHAAVISGLGSMSKQITTETSFYHKLFFFSLKKTNLTITMNKENYSFFRSKLNNNLVKKIPSEGLNTKIEMKIKKNNNYLLYLSRIISEKGIFIIIDAFKKLKKTNPELKLLIAGEMSLSDSVEKPKFFEEINFRDIEYLGEVSENLKMNLLEKSDIVLLPSMYGEGLPMILLEAQLYESLIITTDVTGCRDAVPDFLKEYAFTEFSSKSLSEKIIKYLSLEKKKLTYLKKNSKKWVKENHDFENINNIYNNIFEENKFFN